MHGQLHAAVLEVALFLRGMPFFLADVVGHQFVESDHDLLFLVSRDDGDAAAQPFLE